MTQPMDELYRQLLNAGFLFLREACAARNLDWVNAEIEFLHNVPSLISESNWLRHEYFLVGERSMYMEWAARANIPLQQELMRVRYVPIWEELQKIFKSHSGLFNSKSTSPRAMNVRGMNRERKGATTEYGERKGVTTEYG